MTRRSLFKIIGGSLGMFARYGFPVYHLTRFRHGGPDKFGPWWTQSWWNWGRIPSLNKFWQVIRPEKP